MMKLIRKISKNKISLLLVALSFLNLSCNRENVLLKNDLNGEQMFKEIILFSGKNIENKIPQYSDIIKQLNSLDEIQKKEFEKFKDEIVKNINIINPNFFEKFEKTIKSKNLYSIQEVLSESGDMVMASLAISKDYNIAYKEANKVLDKMKIMKLRDKNDITNFEKKLKLEYKNSINELKNSYKSNKSEGFKDPQAAITIVLVLAVGVVLLLAGAITHAVAAVIAAVWGGVVTKTAVSSLTVSAKNKETLKNDLIVLSISENY